MTADSKDVIGEKSVGVVGNKELIKGLFSTQEVVKIGTGTTTRKTIQKTYWYVEEMADGSMELQSLNSNYVPSGPKKMIPKEDFLAKFSPEPEFYVETVYPKMRALTKTVATADRHRKRGEHFSAEYEYSNALVIDEENVRANFGLGLTYLDRGECNKAHDIFERLVKLDAAFDTEHKHLFNEFGINLRKNKMLDQSLQYYERAVNLAHEDEHLFYNIARTMFDRKDYRATVENLLKSLKMNPALDVSVKFMEWMLSKNLVEADLKKQVLDVLEGSRGAVFQAAKNQNVEPQTETQRTSAQADAEAAAVKKSSSGKPIVIDDPMA